MNDYRLQIDEDEERLWRARLEDEQAAEEMAWREASANTNPVPERTPMPSINDIYGGKKGLKAADLKGRAWLLEIEQVKSFKFTDGEKLILHFAGREKELVVNRTNAQMIAEKLGDDYTTWEGHQIEVYPDKTQFQGSLVDCIRVRFPLPQADPDDHELPF